MELVCLQAIWRNLLIRLSLTSARTYRDTYKLNWIAAVVNIYYIGRPFLMICQGCEKCCRAQQGVVSLVYNSGWCPQVRRPEFNFSIRLMIIYTHPLMRL
jgi:hypothetical protein